MDSLDQIGVVLADFVLRDKDRLVVPELEDQMLPYVVPQLLLRNSNTLVLRSTNSLVLLLHFPGGAHVVPVELIRNLDGDEEHEFGCHCSSLRVDPCDFLDVGSWIHFDVVDLLPVLIKQYLLTHLSILKLYNRRKPHFISYNSNWQITKAIRTEGARGKWALPNTFQSFIVIVCGFEGFESFNSHFFQLKLMNS